MRPTPPFWDTFSGILLAWGVLILCAGLAIGGAIALAQSDQPKTAPLCGHSGVYKVISGNNAEAANSGGNGVLVVCKNGQTRWP